MIEFDDKDFESVHCIHSSTDFDTVQINGTPTTQRPDVNHQVMDEQLRKKAIEANLELVNVCIQQLNAQGIWLDVKEASQDGAVGLCDASWRYDLSLGIRFSTYAIHRVKGAIIDGVRRYEKLGGKNRSQAGVVSQLNNTRALSIFQPLASHRHGDPLTIEDLVPADQTSIEQAVEDDAELQTLYNSISELDPRQKQIILSKLSNLTNKEIASKLNISTRTVTRDHKRALTNLRRILSK